MGTSEKNYYILDYKGDFYRTDNTGQLVVADSRDTAKWFTLEEANQRIGAGKKAHFYHIVSMEELEQKESKEAAHSLRGFQWLEYMNQFLFVNNTIKTYQNELVQSLSDIDLKICDVMHYIELYQETDEQDLEAVRLLRECREERRRIKDEMVRVEWFQKAFTEGGTGTKVKESIKQIGKLESRKYVPRKLPELFAGKEPGKRKAENADTQDDVKNNVILSLREKCAEAHGEAEEEAEMERERSATAYDGKENDWLKFARDQLTFFGNVKQYMINLELDLEEIDKEIADILYQIEDASYNVTQGYKVFKRLKDLRVERRAKDKELRCLETITECFDCEYIEDAYRYSVGAITEIMEPVKFERDVMGKEIAEQDEVVALSV